MIIHSRPFLLFALVFGVSVSLSAAAQPRLAPDPRIPEAAVRGGAMDGPTFAEAALVASGADEPKTDALAARLRTLSGELKSRLPSGADERAKAEAALTFLYDRVLFRYSEFQTRVDAALETGAYNCVSSAILYSYLAKEIGLKVEGVETPQHSFCTVEIGGKKIDVETTNPYGFDPGSRKELPETVAAQKRYVLVPQTKYGNRKPIDDRRLISLVYYNRISELERKGDFLQSVGLAVDAWQLQGMSRKDLAERFLNHAVSLSRSGKHAEGLDFVQTVAGIWGDHPSYRTYSTGAVGNLLNDLMNRKDYAGARALLSDHVPKLDPEAYREMDRRLAFNAVQSSIEGAALREALAGIAAARESLGAGDREKLIVYAYSLEAEKLGRARKWLEAAGVVDEGLQALPRHGDLLRQRSSYRQNHAIGIHNKAAAAYNAGDKTAARALLEAGLAEVPESALLRNSLKTMR